MWLTFTSPILYCRVTDDPGGSMGEQAGATCTRPIARYVSSDGREAKLMLPRSTAEQHYAPPPSIDFYDHDLDQRVTFVFAEEA